MKTFLQIFLKPRTVLFPTPAGWLLLLVLLVSPLALWAFRGEDFLRLTQRQPAKILVVEGWIGDEALQAAAHEFKTGGYDLAVTTGGPNGENWHQKRWTYAEIGFDRLANYGVPRHKIVRADAPDVGSQRTHASALCAKHALARTGHPTQAVNVFTIGSHARRSQAVYAKVFAPETAVGIISWLPPDAASAPWWKSTTRAKGMLTETIGYLYEALLDSGRSSTPTRTPGSPQNI